MDIPTLLAFSVNNQASDLHLSAGLPPLLRIHGDIRPVNLPPLEETTIRCMLQQIMSPEQWRYFNAHQECDFAFTLPDLSRFRVNAFCQEHGTAAAIRTIPATISTLAELGVPGVVGELALRQQGLILVTGPTGAGKSSTLAALVQHINRERQAHILTIEDPLEYIHRSDKSLINQRAVGTHTASFSSALRSALRQDPDVILIGELRDLDTIRLALTAAETGHLVLATLHTSTAARSVSRIIDVFPGDEQAMARSMLAESLTAVLSQTLLKNRSGNGRVAAYELLIATHAIRNLIREDKLAQMYSVMQTMAQALSKLLHNQQITAQDAQGQT